MADPAPEPAPYTAEHVREALLRDPRVGELDLHVVVDGHRVCVTGHVSTVERCRAISDVLAGLLPGYDLRNEVTVSAYPEAPA